ncbi:uncharacterized protein LOC111291810 isoform X2 [Durio zibethinus]|uniref:Uncharacterized protein LOC111291810 isoform X2 n=1 Tax=Durio zibethinus TaxID=66656 RepID=A0A6P5YGW2_DURZI|nr:uncharacterized protein LOC111291810 isoform X2 [Durio zibethinus]
MITPNPFVFFLSLALSLLPIIFGRLAAFPLFSAPFPYLRFLLYMPSRTIHSSGFFQGRCLLSDQRRKRLNGASIAGRNSWDQYRTKKKKLESLQNDWNTKSCISLEWDGNQNKVVAKRDQIGLSRRHLRPFIESTLHFNRVLADVLTLPHETFHLENLTEVLSYEVWRTHLSENERNLLIQFLPMGIDKEQVLQALLAGDNFHFGNPFLKWGTSLCLGHLHPDAVIQEEQRSKAEKKAYYLELQDYHNDIIDYLQKLKEKWESCKNLEEEIVQKLWRSRRVGEKRAFSHSNESRLGNVDQDVTATSESCSWVADEKACSSDNQNSSVVKGGEIQRRMYENGFTKDRIILNASDDVLTVEARSKKGDKLHKRNIQQSDGAKYMSYFKISKKQHELIKNMKQSGRSIQSRSLIRVLGDINSLHVQPYEVFMEEEQRKLREHWLRLAKEDLPAAYANWRGIQLQKWEITKSLEQDMKEKLNLVLEDDEEEDTGKLHCQDDNVGTNLAFLDVEKDPKKLLEDQKDTEATDSESSMEERESVLAFPQNQSPQQICSINSGHTCHHVDMESENNENLSKSDDSSSDVSECLENLNTADATVCQDNPVPSAENVWPADSMPQSYRDSTAGHEYTSASGLPLSHQANEDHQNEMIDLEPDLHEESNGKVLLHGHSEDGSFSSYANQDQNELLQSFFKDQGMLSYHSEQKQTGPDFQPPKNLLMEDGHFNGQFQELLQSSLPLEEGQKRQNEVYMQQNMSENIYSDGVRYLTPRQEHLPSGHMQDWAVDPACMSAPFQHQLNSGELLSQNWFAGEHQVQVRGAWAGSDGFTGPSRSIGSGSNVDQSLFSVLSQCNQLHSSSPYESMVSTEQFIPQRNNGIKSGGTTGIIGNSLQQAAYPLDYIGGRDATTSLMADDMGWMSLAHQSSALHDPMGKPYLRSWNQ